MLKIFNTCILLFLFVSCTNYKAYFNTYFNAQKFFNQALSLKQKRIEKNPLDTVQTTETEKILFEKAIVKSAKVLKLYPKSDASIIHPTIKILSESYYYLDDCDNSSLYYSRLNNLPNASTTLKELDHIHFLECSLVQDQTNINFQSVLKQIDKIQNPQAKINLLRKLALAQEKNQKYQQSINLFQEIINNNNSSISQKNIFRFKQASLYSKLHQWDKVQTLLSSVNSKILLENNQHSFLKLKVKSVYHLNSKQKAITLLKQSIPLANKLENKNELRYLLATWLQKNNQIHLAYEQWQAIVDNPSNEKSLWTSQSLYHILEYTYNYPKSKIKYQDALNNCTSSNLPTTTRCYQFSKNIDNINASAGKITRAKNDSTRNVHYFRIAEIFMLNLQQLDSAKYYFNQIQSSEIDKSETHVKALLVLAELNSENPAQAEIFYKQIIQKYPNTLYSVEAEKKIYKKVLNQSQTSKANKLYEKSELSNSVQAEILLKQLIKKYPKTKTATQARFKLAQQYEEKYNKTNKLENLYQSHLLFFEVSKSKHFPFDSLASNKLSILNLTSKDSIRRDIVLNNPDITEFFPYLNNDFYDDEIQEITPTFDEEETLENF